MGPLIVHLDVLKVLTSLMEIVHVDLSRAGYSGGRWILLNVIEWLRSGYSGFGGPRPGISFRATSLLEHLGGISRSLPMGVRAR